MHHEQLDEVATEEVVRASHHEARDALGGDVDEAFESSDCRLKEGKAFITHASDESRVGQHRREVVRLALGLDGEQILYSDADHILRWIEARPDEVDAALTEPDQDLVVIGRSPAAMDASPQRLRDTEAVVNHIYSLMHPGRDCDLMFAVRRLSPTAARVVVRHADEPTIANDVEWPLLVERHGLSVGYFAADGLSYRTIQDFDGHADGNDHNPLEWIRRVEIAANHAAAMRPFPLTGTLAGDTCSASRASQASVPSLQQSINSQ